MKVKNLGPDAFDFTTALHTYFAIGDIHQTTVFPLKGEYLDKILVKPLEQHEPVVQLTGPTDKIFYNAADEISIAGSGVQLTLTKSHFKDLVVWNCWEEAAKTIADLGPDDWKSYVCCEVATVKNPILVKPGEEWKASHSFHLNQGPGKI